MFAFMQGAAGKYSFLATEPFFIVMMFTSIHVFYKETY